eukprot:7576990-Pyramimonas_sp.AAC.1
MPIGDSFLSVEFNRKPYVDDAITNPSSEDFDRNASVEGFDRNPPWEDCQSNANAVPMVAILRGGLQHEPFLWRVSAGVLLRRESWGFPSAMPKQRRRNAKPMPRRPQ